MAKKTSKTYWDELLGDEQVRNAGNRAAQKTNEQLADQIAKLSALKLSEVQELFPKKTDQNKLVELMQIVKSSQSKNKKVTEITENIEKFAGIIVSLLGKFV